MTGKHPLVSIIMPVYNDEQYVRQGVESILQQTITDFECIIINDGSTDRTGEILKAITDTRVTVVTNKQNLGLAKTPNIGNRMARGQYLARADADDISKPDRLKKQIAFLDANPDHVLVGSWNGFIDKEGHYIHTEKRFSTDRQLREAMRSSNQFCHGSVMLRREIAAELGFYREILPHAEDYDLFLRLSEKGKIANIEEVLYLYRMDVDSISFNKKAEQDSYARVVRLLAEQRKKQGQDILQTGTKEQISAFLEKNLKTSFIEARKNQAENYYTWGRYLFYRNSPHQEVKKWMIKALYNNPFVCFNAWKILIKCYLGQPLSNAVSKLRQFFSKSSQR